MNQLFLFLFLCTFLSSYSQSEYDGPEMQRLKSDTVAMRKYQEKMKAFIDENSNLFLSQPQHINEFTDTVPCIMLVSDTAMNRSLAFSLNGFAIRRHYWAYHPDYAVINEQMEVDITGYLDERHRRINYFVWISKNLKP